jgi:hypothetical protein
MLVYQRVLTAGLLWSEKNQLSEGFISNFNSTTSRRSVHFFSLIRRSYHCHILSSCLAQPSQYPPNNHSMPFIINMWTVWVGAWVSRYPSVPIGTHRYPSVRRTWKPSSLQGSLQWTGAFACCVQKDCSWSNFYSKHSGMFVILIYLILLHDLSAFGHPLWHSSLHCIRLPGDSKLWHPGGR